jgi:glycosyltransferase involved in cell wall biosynthesis
MKVSVLMLAYDHERFVVQALESACAQEAEFPFEVVVGEDCSRDRTRALVRDFAARHPDRVRLVLSESNRGMWENFRETLAACSGEYVALLEGDDYWTSPHKLARQVAQLDAEPGLALSFHAAEIRFEEGPLEPRRFDRTRAQLDDLLLRNFITTASVMLRRSTIEGLPEWLARAPMLDWPLFLLSARHGDLGYLDEPMAVYRIHAGGLWSGASAASRVRAELAVYDLIAAELGAPHAAALFAGRSRRHFDLAWLLARDGRRGAAWQHVWKSLRLRPFNHLIARAEMGKLLLFLLAPVLFRQLARR